MSVAILAAVAMVAGALYMVLNRQSASERAVYRDDAKICYVALNHLKCRDKQGNNAVRYDLPDMKDKNPVKYMFASRDRKTFVAIWTGDKGWPQFTLLDEHLKVTKEIDLLKDMQASNVSFSQDGKSLLVDMGKIEDTQYGPQIRTQVYRYDIAKGSFTQLTKADGNMTASMPFEMPDGRIVFWQATFNEPAKGKISVMDNDGKNVHALKLPANDATPIHSYDAMTDQLFVFGADSEGQIWHGTLADFEKGSFKKVKHSANAYSYMAFMISPTEVLLEGDLSGKEAIVRSLTDGSEVRKIAVEGPLVGIMQTDKFAKSAQQEETKFERIVGLAKTPADFQAFIKPVFEADDAECNKIDNGKSEYEVYDVVGDRFVHLSASCTADGGAHRYFTKVDGQWKHAYSRQDFGPIACEVANEFKVTKEAEPTCLDAKDQEVPNQNP